MSNLSFLTPLSYGVRPKSCCESFLEGVDNYLYIAGEKAILLPGQENAVVLEKDCESLGWIIVKVISYCTVIFPLIALAIRAISRSNFRVEIIDAQRVLETGVEISAATLSRIRELMPFIIDPNGDSDEERQSNIRRLDKNLSSETFSARLRENLKAYRDRSGIKLFKLDPDGYALLGNNNRIFKIDGIPNMIFKMRSHHWCAPDNEEVDLRYENMKRAKHEQLKFNLDRVTIPHARKFEVEYQGQRYTVIAEQAFDGVSPDNRENEELYKAAGEHLDEPMRQAAILVARTGLHDVVERNMPYLNGNLLFFDWEHASGPELGILGPQVGIFGGDYPDGPINVRGLLFCCTSEAQIDTVLRTAKEHGVTTDATYEDRIKQHAVRKLKKPQETTPLLSSKLVVA